MLKWTVLPRRDSVKPDASRPLSPSCRTTTTTTPKSKSKRRRSSTSRRSSLHKRASLDALEADKENQFTSTPIKSSDNFLQFDALRDVSNLTPTDKRRIPSAKKCKSERKNVTPGSSPRLQHKKKKRCRTSHGLADSQCSNYFKPFETVDSHIEGILDEESCHCKITERVAEIYAPTLPVVYTPCPLRTPLCRNVQQIAKAMEDEDVPPNKKPKVDHLDDFLHQITHDTSSELIFPGLRLNSTTKVYPNELKVSPLVKKFLDLKFNKVSADTRVQSQCNDSSFINEMSLDKIVDAILNTSDDSIRPTVRKALNTSLIVNVNDNDLNESHEENFMNMEHDQKNLAIENISENSSDSGFRSSATENLHQLDNNFICKCNNNNKDKVMDSNTVIDRTIIPTDETFNERCVDEDLTSRKRPSSTILDGETVSKKVFLDKSLEDVSKFTLRRQRCIRRRRTDEKKMKYYSAGKNSVFCEIENTSFSSSKIMDFESTPLRNCYLENKEIGGDTFVTETPTEESRSIRRCLLFDSPKNDSVSLSESTSTTRSGIIDVRGSVDLNIYAEDDVIFINIIRCKDLYRPNGEKINAYVKVALSDRLGDSRRKRNAVLQRTAVQGDSCRPHFNHTFKLPVVSGDTQKRIHVEVWHRDRITRTSEFLGCMSFDVRNAIDTGFSGSFKLLPQSTGRSTYAPITQNDDRLLDAKMCESHSSVDELMSLEDLENDLKKSSRSVLSEQQKYADENLFLRYLELDPTEGPDATSAATQRKATGNRNGRTPFTCTKRLTRPPKSGFGFSVVWTHPPRIERVEKGLPADRAGILPGDYIIFVDKHNVVMMPEIDILNLIRSYGSQLTLEIFRRNPSRNGSLPSVKRLSTPLATSRGTLGSSSILPVTSVTSSSNLVQRRPSTVCSTNTASVDYNRRKLHLPQVTFSAEKPTANPEENRRKAMFQLIGKEQQYATGLQFAVARFVSPLAERKDLITPAEHRTLFQNCEEILRITEDILDNLSQEDGDQQTHLLVRTYHMKLHEITTAYRRYCSGIKKADCILANKSKNSNSDFSRFLQVPQIPRRRPDITTFIHKPLEHYRDMLRLLTAVQHNTKPNHDDFPVINQVVHDLQLTYREITSEAGLMEPVGEGRPLLTVQDLENRLVFTKCKPFVLNKPGRQWIFGGDLSRVEGRNVRQYWTLLFSDLLLFAKTSRDRVLFVMEEPLPLAHITDMFFNVRKKDTEFRITINPEGAKAKSPTVHCGPDLSRTPRKNANKKTVILRAPTPELKAVWQNLLQRQIFHLNSGMDGSSVSSPLESPDVAPVITSSVGTLQSAESLSQRRQTPQNLNQICQNENKEAIQKHLDALIEHKCKQLCKSSFNSKCNAIHLEQWMKGQLDGQIRACETPDMEPVYEEWTEEMLRKRSEELQLIDSQGNVTCCTLEGKRNESRCEDVALSDDQSPSKTTTTESQVTVRSSPLIPDTMLVCRQCHQNCLSSNATTNGSIQNYSDCNNSRDNPKAFDLKDENRNDEENDWQPLVLLGLMANPASSLVKIDPFSTQPPKISVVPATPESSIKTTSTENRYRHQCQNTKQDHNDNPIKKRIEFTNFDLCNEVDNSPDDSPQTEEHPYHSLSSSVATLRRFGTMSSLEKFGSEGHEDAWENHVSSESEDDEEEEDEEDEEVDEISELDFQGGIDNRAFNNSSIRHWTVRAGSFVAEKMAFFEKWGEDYRSGAFFDRYLKSAEAPVNGEEQQEDETSGATSGEEIWGTPTSGDLDDTLNSPSYEDKQSPNDGSLSSDFGDDTEIMMDELLMTPPISGAVMRGLLPRRTLEPLIEEASETSSSSSMDPPTEPSVSPEQGNGTGDAADTCSGAAASLEQSDQPIPPSPIDERRTQQQENAPSPSSPKVEEAETPPTPTEEVVVPKMHRSESYRRIIEAAEDADDEDATGNTLFFNRFRPTAKFVNIERVPRSKSIKIFEFFNVRKPERRIYETFPEGRHMIKVFSPEDSETDCIPPSYPPKPLSPRRLKDKQLDRRFWKQLSRRRGSKTNFPA